MPQCVLELLGFCVSSLAFIVEIPKLFIGRLSLSQACLLNRLLLRVAVSLVLLSDFIPVLLVPHTLELLASLADHIVLTFLKLVNVVP